MVSISHTHTGTLRATTTGQQPSLPS